MTQENQYTEVNKIINKYCSEPKRRNDLFFIQIGAHDGITGDPIHDYIIKYEWKGILVEPVHYLFRKLQSTYDGFNGLFFENVAISEQSGKKTFYRINANNVPKMPHWYDQLGSFKKDVVEKHRNVIPNFDELLISEEINCITIVDLFRKYNVTKIDYLQIDTEGYDAEIIKQLPFEILKPAMILYEHKHLETDDKKNTTDLLNRNGYKLILTDSCTFAYLA